MTVTTMMRGVLLTGHGGLDKLVYRDDLPVSQPEVGEVLIQVSACGVNNTDINTRVGWYAKSVVGATAEATSAARDDGSWGGGLTFPRIQGADPLGRIVAVGAGVATSRIGERVMVDPWVRDPSGDLAKASYLGSELDGGFAEFVKVPSINAHAARSELTDVELASIPCSYSAAEHMLTRAGVTAGHWVLVTGASGGVGTALIQLSRLRDARVVAITNAAKVRAIEELGAEVVLDRGSGDLDRQVMAATGGVDVFADVVGGDSFAPLLETIRRGGHYVSSGAIGGPIVPLDLRTVYLHDLTLHGATVFAPEVFARLVVHVESGAIRPTVAGTFPLEQIAAAQQAFLTKDHIGSLVIDLRE